jgi:hypothetical protein
MTADCRSRAWFRRASGCVVIAAMTLFAAGCGGGSPTGSSGGSPSSSADTSYQQRLAYSQCMRSHGVPGFPDPPGAGQPAATSGASINQNSPAYQAAHQTCQHLLPGGGQVSKAQVQQMMNQLLKFSACMRAHGVPDFPDPTMVNGLPRINGTSPAWNGPHAKSAENMCDKYISGAGPNPGGGS